VLLKQVFAFHCKGFEEILGSFFYLLNAELSKLSFYKFNRQTIRDLGQVIEIVENANSRVFSKVNIQTCLYLFENTYQGTNLESRCIQRRRCIQLREDTEELKNLIRFV
jgi:hypothetical protein